MKRKAKDAVEPNGPQKRTYPEEDVKSLFHEHVFEPKSRAAYKAQYAKSEPWVMIFPLIKCPILITPLVISMESSGI
jgi:hypothetical protein